MDARATLAPGDRVRLYGRPDRNGIAPTWLGRLKRVPADTGRFIVACDDGRTRTTTKRMNLDRAPS
ncbi:hypothetical protein KIKIMORA_04940 [Brevundimonas phage vB_BpoS-Kikimora]|uniref:DUF1918 domain-containing protein n=1 Tax=Brevundimonas phage vB_BpoS-Kikimora TaxID=2948601 RepID=A0A9E7SMX1_9CAUD|nr:hypothetical protein KIKIMORA_04940 [Brevundimonas phage vB_BpoS-Kikimora]